MKEVPNTLARPQAGFSKFSFLLMLLLLAGVISIAVKIMPVYIDHNFVRGVAEVLVESGRANSLTQEELREEMAASMRINNVRNVDIEDIRTVKTNGNTVIDISYERRIALVFNIDIILSFNDQIQ